LEEKDIELIQRALKSVVTMAIPTSTGGDRENQNTAGIQTDLPPVKSFIP